MVRGLLLAGHAEAAQRWLDILDPNAPDNADEVQQLNLAFAHCRAKSAAQCRRKTRFGQSLRCRAPPPDYADADRYRSAATALDQPPVMPVRENLQLNWRRNCVPERFSIWGYLKLRRAS